MTLADGGGDLLGQTFVYLTAAVVSVPIAKRLGLGSVLGYLIAGVAIGPFGLALVGEEGTDVMHFAEFGVVMMLFLIGLELRPALLWKMRAPILGQGGLQVLLTLGAVAGIGLGFGLPPSEALVIGMMLALSSTAIVLQTLEEKGTSKSTVGQSAFAVLLFQDIAVIPMLAVMPLLGVAVENSGDPLWIETLPGWAHGLVVLGVVAGIVIGGRYLARPVFRFIAAARLREIFTAAALLLVVGIALLMGAVGLSAALGTFLAGVVLADNEFRHELEADVEPFKGLLLGLFFIAVGAAIDFELLANAPLTVAGLVLGLMTLKFVILFGIGRVFRLKLPEALGFGASLAQGGEFAFVLGSFAVQSQALPEDTGALVIVAVALSMLLTPLVLLFDERFVQPRFARLIDEPQTSPDLALNREQVVIAGFGRFGVTLLRLLKASGFEATVLDTDAAQIEALERFGHLAYYGDAARPELLEMAGVGQARAFVVAVEDTEKTYEIVRQAMKHYPHVPLYVRARDMAQAQTLIEMGCKVVERETLGSALELGSEVLTGLGVPANVAHRKARLFRRHEGRMMRELASLRGDDHAYIARARLRSDELERLLESESASEPIDGQDVAFDVEELLREVRDDEARG